MAEGISSFKKVSFLCEVSPSPNTHSLLKTNILTPNQRGMNATRSFVVGANVWAILLL